MVGAGLPHCMASGSQVWLIIETLGGALESAGRLLEPSSEAHSEGCESGFCLLKSMPWGPPHSALEAILLPGAAEDDSFTRLAGTQ